MDYINIDMGNVQYIQRNEFSKLIKIEKDIEKKTQFDSISDLDKIDYEIIRDYINIITNPDEYFEYDIDENNIRIKKFNQESHPRINHLIIPNEINGIKVNSLFRMGGVSSCNYIKSIIMPDTIEDIKGALFYNCPILKQVKLSKNIDDLSTSMFSNCQSLERINLENIKTIGYKVFQDCVSLQKVKLTNLNYVRESAFENCQSIKKLVMPNITYLAKRTFYNCNNLTSVSLGKELMFIGEACFYRCKKLEKINIPEKINIIKESVFALCKSLNHIIFPEKLNAIETNAFYKCGITEVNIPQNVSHIYERAFDETTLSKITVYNTTNIDENAFNYKSKFNIKTLTFKDKKEEILEKE